MLVFGIAAAILLSVRAQRDATDRCTTTPPGFPARLEGANVSVEWSWGEPGYVCVYRRSDGATETTSPP